MLQRIQSIFLLLGAGSCFGLFATDLADTPTAVSDSDLFADASFNLFDNPFLLGITVLAGLVLLAAIFLFRNRKLQMNIVLLGLGSLGAFVGFAGFEFFSDTAREAAVPDFGVALPLVAIVMGFLAYYNIGKDEKLVRSADRLR
ncbi:MAG: DUF4293 domain-containing protein [Bacteroidota bacterium]